MNNKQIQLLPSQQRVLDQLKSFVESTEKRVFILKGFAGTGKTTLMHFFIQYLKEQNRTFRMMAPTGRAAKVLSDIALNNRFADQSNHAASTIHSWIYRFDGFNRDVSQLEMDGADPDGQLHLVFAPIERVSQTKRESCVYIVDEASMINNHAEPNVSQALFSEDGLLNDLMKSDSNPYSKYVFVGDPCQLPPVGEPTSPALDVASFTDGVESASLTEIMRQAGDNDLIRLSTLIRKKAENAPTSDLFYRGQFLWTKLPFRYAHNIAWHSDNDEMYDHYTKQIQRKGYTDSIFICRTNKDTTKSSLAIREKLGYRHTLPERGELLMVIQNHLLSGMVNGDFVEVMDVGQKVYERGGISFIYVKVKECVSGTTHAGLLMLDVLSSEQPNLSSLAQTRLFMDFIRRMYSQGIKQKSEQFTEALHKDPYLNALRCNYGYAVTCHKAQGGEWNHVYLKLPRNIGLNPTRYTYQWLYTAITRAKQTLHLVDDGIYII